MEIKKEFGELKEFEGMSVSLYRSSDPINTETYFTSRREEGTRTGNAFFELLVFKYNFGKKVHHMYLRYPDEDYFTELYGGGSCSAHGTMETTSAQNIWEEHNCHKLIDIKKQDYNLLLSFGEFVTSFNFMTLVGRFSSKDNEYYKNDILSFNLEEINQSLNKKYLKIPDSIREIEYLMKLQLPSYTLKDDNLELNNLELNINQVIYFVVDYPAYNFNYTNHRFRIIRGKEIEECKVKDFVRYRDGGTTIITVIDSKGNEHEFFSPTNLCDPRDRENATWDKQILIEKVSEKEKEKIIALLNIEVKPKNKK